LRQGLMNYLPRLALNCNPPDLCLLCSRHAPGTQILWAFEEFFFILVSFSLLGTVTKYLTLGD
jgi:hypothetical protein